MQAISFPGKCMFLGSKGLQMFGHGDPCKVARGYHISSVLTATNWLPKSFRVGRGYMLDMYMLDVFLKTCSTLVVEMRS